MSSPASTPCTHVLIIEDDAGLADLEARRLRRIGMAASSVHSLAEGLKVLSQQATDLIVVDYSLPDGHAGKLLDWLHEAKRDIPVVVVTGNGDEHVAVEMMKWGARDYLVKSSQTLDLLPEVVGRVLEKERLRYALEEAQRRYQFIVDNISDVIVLIDPTGKVEYVSPTFVRLTGYPPDILSGREWVSLVHPDDVNPLLAATENAGTYRPAVVECRFRTARGEWCWVEVVSQHMVDADGHVTQMISTIRNISDRKMAEQQQQAYTSIIEAAATASHEITAAKGQNSPDWVLTALLDRVVAVLGVDAVAIIGLEESSMVLRCCSGEWSESFIQRSRPRGGGYLGMVESTADQVEFHGDEIRAHVVSDFVRTAGVETVLGTPMQVNGEMIGVLHVQTRERRLFSDSEKRLLRVAAERCAIVMANARLQTQLAASESRYRNLVESAVDWIWEMDRDGVITYSNRAASHISGYSPEELIGHSARDLYWNQEELEGNLHQFLAADPDNPYETELTVRHRLGHPVHLQVRGSTLRGPSGEAIGTSGVARDVTGQRRLQEQLREAQRMEAIGRLAGGVAHDFNNLLTGILGAAQLLQEQISREHPFWEDVDLIISGAQRAAGLTRQLLAFGRRQPMAFVPVQINDVVTDICKLIERTIGTDIAISLELEQDMAPILADSGQLEQVLLNLAVNARDAMPGGGQLRIATTVEQLTPVFAQREAWARPGRFVRLTVTDTGTGMDEATRARIFEPYFSTKASYGGGTGLGLAMVHGIVTQHQGLIQVSSEPGVGTEFSIYLPVAEVEYVRSEGPAPVPEVHSGNERILVAEDEEAVRRLVERVLISKGYSVVMTSTGRAAVQQFEAQPAAFDLVILDAVMPEMNGKEAMTAILAIRPEVPILLMSGYAQDVLGDNLAALGNPVFMQKPFSPAELVRQVRTVLDAR